MEKISIKPDLMMTIGGSKLTKTNILRERKFSANMITEDNLKPAIYAPYHYFSIGERLGAMGEWREHLND